MEILLYCAAAAVLGFRTFLLQRKDFVNVIWALAAFFLGIAVSAAGILMPGASPAGAAAGAGAEARITDLFREILFGRTLWEQLLLLAGILVIIKAAKPKNTYGVLLVAAFSGIGFGWWDVIRASSGGAGADAVGMLLNCLLVAGECANGILAGVLLAIAALKGKSPAAAALALLALLLPALLRAAYGTALSTASEYGGASGIFSMVTLSRAAFTIILLAVRRGVSRSPLYFGAEETGQAGEITRISHIRRTKT